MTIAREFRPKFVEPINMGMSQKEGPKFYNVMLHKIGGRWNEFYMGSVVTHLSLEDWCAWKGYKLVQVYAGMRDAKLSEKTNLF